MQQLKRYDIELKGVIEEDMVNYRKIGMTLMFPKCNWKCDIENGVQLCQNKGLAATASQTVDVKALLERYKNNPITEAIILQGLEPLDSPVDVYTVAALLKELNITDDLVIYTGYKKEEVSSEDLQTIANIIPGKLIIKWGRYIPNQEKHYDEILGVYLASDNQYAEIINKI